MKISKWLIAVIAVMLVIAMVGCGGTSKEDENPEITGSQQENTDPEQTLDAEIGLVDGNIFDDTDIVETQNPTTPKETEPEATQPTVTKPEHLNPDEDGQEDPNQPEQDPSEPDTTKPTVTTPSATEPVQTNPGELTYEQFRDLTPSQQQAYQETFESIEAFFEWYNAAKDAYDEANPPILIGPDGVVDLNKIP